MKNTLDKGDIIITDQSKYLVIEMPNDGLTHALLDLNTLVVVPFHGEEDLTAEDLYRSVARIDERITNIISDTNSMALHSDCVFVRIFRK